VNLRPASSILRTWRPVRHSALAAPRWGKDAHPNLLHRWVRRPEIDELRDVTAAFHYEAGDGAVNRNVMSLDIAQDALVGSWFAADVMLRLQAIDRNYELKVRQRGPRQWDWTEGAGHNLDVSALNQLRQQDIKLAVSNERVAPHDR